jgi:hypothetical protein
VCTYGAADLLEEREDVDFGGRLTVLAGVDDAHVEVIQQLSANRQQSGHASCIPPPNVHIPANQHSATNQPTFTKFSTMCMRTEGSSEALGLPIGEEQVHAEAIARYLTTYM